MREEIKIEKGSDLRGSSSTYMNKQASLINVIVVGFLLNFHVHVDVNGRNNLNVRGFVFSIFVILFKCWQLFCVFPIYLYCLFSFSFSSVSLQTTRRMREENVG